MKPKKNFRFMLLRATARTVSIFMPAPQSGDLPSDLSISGKSVVVPAP